MGKFKYTTARLSPVLKYLCQLAGRKEHRHTCNFIEYALLQEIRKFTLPDGEQLIDKAGLLWDEDNIERIKKLEQNYPSLLTYDEKVLLKNWRKENDAGS